ncbi:hypothetical protein KW805_02435 [Candidatus Pacearchaeota archaeon]|nr:hypothetical protein [Candidatus Pacearchaeota archaeon]
MNTRLLLIAVAVIITAGAFASAATFSSSNPSTFAPDFQTYYSGDRLQTYWPILGDRDTCEARQDILLQIAPGGCQPAVVRSDLLAEQNVPVFCQIDALQVNPLLDIKSINNIRFSGNYPPEIAGSGFHPAQAALTTRDRLLGSPLINNIGYAVIVLKKNPQEKTLPDFVNVTLTGRIEYDAGNALGIGRSEFLLKPTTDEEWKTERLKQSFWQGRYFVRLERVDENFATISLYNGDRRITTTRVALGKASSNVYLPGFYCQAGLTIEYGAYEAAQDSARIEITDDRGTEKIDVYEGSRFLDDKCSVIKLNATNSEAGNVTISCGSDRFVLSRGLRNPENAALTLVDKTWGAQIDQNFTETIEALKKVARDYPAEQNKNGNGLSYGEQALAQAVDLAEQFGKQKTEVSLIELLIGSYPASASSSIYTGRLSDLYKIDSSLSGYSLNVDNRYRSIRVVGFSIPTTKPAAYFTLGARALTLHKGEQTQMGSTQTQKSFIRLDSLEVGKARVTISCDGKSRSETIKQGESVNDACGSVLRFTNADLDAVARIRLIPRAGDLGTETNLTVKIGIEKRAIQLSPNKTQELISRLNDSIQKWDSISGNLGKVVSGLKGACFATAGVLTFKNFITGLSGEAVARQEVMRGDNGWTVKCKELVAAHTYETLDQCFNTKADDIEKDVSATASSMERVNARIKDIEANSKSSQATFGDSIDTDLAKQKLAREIRDKYPDEQIAMPKGSQWVTTPGSAGTSSTVAVKDVLSDQNLNSMSYQEVRNIYMNIEREKAGGLSAGGLANAQSALGESAARINSNRASDYMAQQAKSVKALGYASPFYVAGTGQTDRLTEVTPLASLNSQEKSKLGFTTSTHTATVNVLPGSSSSIPTGTYILGLTEVSPGIYEVAEVRNKATYEQKDPVEFNRNLKIGAIKAVNTATYNNKYQNAEVRYYEVEPYKGMPAVVPFDTVNGWYAGTKQTLPALGGIGAFDANGRVSSFWLCNVGNNGREQFEETGYGDDICQLINVNTGQPLGVFPGLSDQEAKSLVERAIRALTDASQQSKNPNVRIGSETYKVGKPAVGVPTTQCQDFMSPKDCQLLFNVCDPVICPASRCNLGGAYQVTDVIQTGIVGSALLCLPNAREGIAIPVCLSGIHAGIESYVSILKSHRDCLQENLNSGKLVGICDQIHSIYLCEFFWRQIAPVANVILPKIVELAYGQGTRGGGEYLTVMGAWQNTQNSINYFTQTYAVNSIKAFQIRSIEEAGTPFCKAFVSMKAPSSFKNLVEPDSPPQFNAYFDAIPFSSVTVPATSQYSVFYHIFAGNDAGIYYSVYLKDPPESSFYISTPTIQIVSGFVAKGAYASEKRDFTAPEGYKNLCVRINNEERCGFKQVSTDFAVNYLRDQYVAGAITDKDITTQNGCVSGTGRANLGALAANTNPGAAVSEATLPQDYQRGIIRICASNNPGSSTDPLRFVSVGYCDTPKVTCWLDTKSVNNALTDSNIDLKNKTLSELGTQTKAYLEGQGEVFTDSQSLVELQSLETAKENLDIKNPQAIKALFDRMDFAMSKLYLNNDKAKLLFLRAQVYVRILGQPLFVSTINSGKKTTTSTVSSTQGYIAQHGKTPVLDGEGRWKVDFGGSVGSYGLSPDNKLQFFSQGKWSDVDQGMDAFKQGLKNELIAWKEAHGVSGENRAAVTLSSAYDVNKKIYLNDEGQQTKVYVQSGRVYIDPADNIGVFDGTTMRLFNDAEAKIPALFSRLNGAHLEGNTFAGSSAS